MHPRLGSRDPGGAGFTDRAKTIARWTKVAIDHHPDAQRVASELRRTLERQRLWSQVTVTGDRVDVQSSSCDDPAMAPLLDSAAPAFKAAGLTSLRCLEQSGRVVTDRDL